MEKPGAAPAGSAIAPKRTHVKPVADGSQAGGVGVKRTDKAMDWVLIAGAGFR